MCARVYGIDARINRRCLACFCRSRCRWTDRRMGGSILCRCRSINARRDCASHPPLLVSHPSTRYRASILRTLCLPVCPQLLASFRRCLEVPRLSSKRKHGGRPHRARQDQAGSRLKRRRSGRSRSFSSLTSDCYAERMRKRRWRSSAILLSRHDDTERIRLRFVAAQQRDNEVCAANR